MLRIPLVGLFISFLLFSTFSVTLAQDATQATTGGKTVEYTVTSKTANLRSGPGTNFKVVATAAAGDSLMIYDEQPQVSGWLRVYRAGSDDAYIADYLVERAPMRFYPADQEPIVSISGRGKNISDVYDFPQGAYRVDVNVQDNAFILKTVAVSGDCSDDTLINELYPGNKVVASALFASKGCSVLFQTDNVDGNWSIEVRSILDPAVLIASTVQLETGSSVAGTGRALTMPTHLPEGIWRISAQVQDRAFILHAHPIGDCEETAVFNELDFAADKLDVSAVYRSPENGCIIFWETSNVEGNWELHFDKIR